MQKAKTSHTKKENLPARKPNNKAIGGNDFSLTGVNLDDNDDGFSPPIGYTKPEGYIVMFGAKVTI